MKIKKISLINADGGFFWQENRIEIYDKRNDKPIDIFYIPNKQWKTLIFNALNFLFSYDRDNYVKDTNKYLTVEVEFELEGKIFTYFWSYKNFVVKDEEGNEVKNFGAVLEKSLWMEDIDLMYHQTKRNTLKSLNRFVFLTYEGIRDKEKENEIPLVNSNYDGGSKKVILAYFLWADIEKNMFEVISNLEYKKNYIEEREKKFSPYEENLRQMNLWKDGLDKAFYDLQEKRQLLWDVTIASGELEKLRNDYIFLFGREGDDINFLDSEVNSIKHIKETVTKDIKELKVNIKKWNVLEQWQYLSGVHNIFKSKDLLEYEIFKRYKKEIEELNKWYGLEKIQTYISEHIDKYIKDFKLFLDDLYEEFIKQSVDKWLIKQEDIIDYKNAIVFNEDELKIHISFGTSEWVRKAIRVLSFMWLHLYSLNKKKVRSIDISFYDTFIENTGKEYRDAIFDSIFNFILKNDYRTSKMMLFISDIERSQKSSIHNIANKYVDYIDLYESEGLKAIL